ncbi:MAG TPA: nuclear transport factor 2 family protein [Chloroflexota bacterium]|nr:nuclear transport factor 2 family protein [Chloroflexota bacterium]
MGDLTRERALELAQAWIDAWNAHDLDAILAHYADEVEFISPFVQRLLGDPSGIVRGKAALRDYFARGLASYPDLRFDLLEVLAGVRSVTVYYRSVRGLLAAEVMCLADDGRVERVLAHYTG